MYTAMQELQRPPVRVTITNLAFSHAACHRFQAAASVSGLELRRRKLLRCVEPAVLAERDSAGLPPAASGAAREVSAERSEEARLSEDLREWCRSEPARERSSCRPASCGPREANARCPFVCLVMLPRVRVDACMH